MSEYLFKGKVLGVGEYKVPKEPAEIVAGWKKEVENILEQIESADFDEKSLGIILGGGSSNEYVAKRGVGLVQKAKAMLGEGSWNKEEKTMFAIGLWLMSKKGKWSDVKEAWKALKGGTYPLAEGVKNSDVSGCAESSVTAQLMAGEFGIKGEIVSVGMDAKVSTLGAGFVPSFV